jgi:hypothetical protein
MQSKRQTHIEVGTNMFTGLMVGWCIVYFIFPLLEQYSNLTRANVSSIMFFIASYIRSYTLRRYFNWLWRGDKYDKDVVRS